MNFDCFIDCFHLLEAIRISFFLKVCFLSHLKVQLISTFASFEFSLKSIFNQLQYYLIVFLGHFSRCLSYYLGAKNQYFNGINGGNRFWNE